MWMSWKQCFLIIENYPNFLMRSRWKFKQCSLIVENYQNNLMIDRWRWKLRIIQLRGRWRWRQYSVVLENYPNYLMIARWSWRRRNAQIIRLEFRTSMNLDFPPFSVLQTQRLCRETQKKHWPEVEEAEGGDGGEEETDEDYWVGSPSHQLPPPEEQTFQAADYKPTCHVHRSHNFCDLRLIRG